MKKQVGTAARFSRLFSFSLLPVHSNAALPAFKCIMTPDFAQRNTFELEEISCRDPSDQDANQDLHTLLEHDCKVEMHFLFFFFF